MAFKILNEENLDDSIRLVKVQCRVKQSLTKKEWSLAEKPRWEFTVYDGVSWRNDDCRNQHKGIHRNFTTEFAISNDVEKIRFVSDLGSYELAPTPICDLEISEYDDNYDEDVQDWC